MYLKIYFYSVYIMELNNKFYKDLKEGEKYEMKLLDHIEYIKYLKPPGYFKEYDLKIYHKIKRYATYEIKSDKQINIFGNICIEYMCKNKPSGIATSKATYWAIFEPKDTLYRLYIIPSYIIRKFIEEKKYKRDCSGGDNYASQLYLFDKKIFKDYIIYNDISE